MPGKLGRAANQVKRPLCKRRELAIEAICLFNDAMPEYYIKRTPGSEAEGPYTEETLQRMAASGKVTPSTLHFYDDAVGWRPIASDQVLSEHLFEVQKPKLSLKQRSVGEEAAAPAKPAHVAARGIPDSGASKGSSDSVACRRKWEDRVATFSMPLLSLVNLAMGVLLLWANYKKLAELLPTEGFRSFLYVPGLALGGLIFLLGVFLFLTVAAVYPAVRYAAFALMTYFGILSWGRLYEGQVDGMFLLLSGVGFGLGVYISTLTLNFLLFLVSMTAAVLGVYSYVYFLFLL